MVTYLHDNVKDRSDRNGEILKGYTIGIAIFICGLVLLYIKISFGIHLLWIGALIFIAYKLTARKIKRRYY